MVFGMKFENKKMYDLFAKFSIKTSLGMQVGNRGIFFKDCYFTLVKIYVIHR